MTSFKDIDSFGESRTLQKQSSDDSDKALEKLATDTVVIKNRKNNPAALVINADISNDPVSRGFGAEFKKFFHQLMFL